MSLSRNHDLITQGNLQTLLFVVYVGTIVFVPNYIIYIGAK